MDGKKVMAGESAREVARRAREKAARLNKRAEMLERGADGEAATAEVLTSLPEGWVALHDVRWLGRRLANVDHVLVGPGGVFVIDSKNWSGRIAVQDGSLRQSGYSREKAVVGAADAALAVSELISPYAAWVHPALCFVGQDHLTGWSRDVMVCSSTNLAAMLASRPVVFTQDIVHYVHGQLAITLSRATSSPPTVTRSPRPVAVSGVGPLRGPLAVRSAADRVGLGRHQRLHERGQHAAQQVGLGALQVLGQERRQVNRVGVDGHRCVSFSRTSQGLLKDHAVAVPVSGRHA